MDEPNHTLAVYCGQLWVRHMFCGRDLWWTIPLHIFFRLYSEIDHIHLSIEAQCDSHHLPPGDCHTVHEDILKKLCRLCSGRLQTKGKKSQTRKVEKYAWLIKTNYGIDVSRDDARHPKNFCSTCMAHMYNAKRPSPSLGAWALILGIEQWVHTPPSPSLGAWALILGIEQWVHTPLTPSWVVVSLQQESTDFCWTLTSFTLHTCQNFKWSKFIILQDRNNQINTRINLTGHPPRNTESWLPKKLGIPQSGYIS